MCINDINSDALKLMSKIGTKLVLGELPSNTSGIGGQKVAIFQDQAQVWCISDEKLVINPGNC